MDNTRSPSIFGDYDSPHPEGVSQGGIGNCWFLAGAAAVAENTERLFININEDNVDTPWNDAGIFRFYFYVKGNLIGINVDSRLPAQQNYG